MASRSETLQVTGIRCERCVMRLGGVLGRLDGIEHANASLMGQVTLAWDDARLEREQIVAALAAGGFRVTVEPGIGRRPRPLSTNVVVGSLAVADATPDEVRELASAARHRIRFEEDALALSDDVYRVARRLAGSREEAEDLVQETYLRAFRSWRSFTPGTNLRAWLLRILTNLNIDRGRRQQRAPETQPIEEGDYFLYAKLEEDGPTDEDRLVERLSQDSIVEALASVPHDFRDVLVLVDLSDFSYADAAQILDIPIGTVMSRLHRGRRVLKRELADRTVTG